MPPTARGALVDLVTNERLPFQFNPEEFELTAGAEWHVDTPPGRLAHRAQLPR